MTTPQSRTPDGKLELSGEKKPGETSARTVGRKATGGFNPYESDGGHAKPHAWEKVDRK